MSNEKIHTLTIILIALFTGGDSYFTVTTPTFQNQHYYTKVNAYHFVFFLVFKTGLAHALSYWGMCAMIDNSYSLQFNTIST